ncbi:hypothetical protein Tco_0597286 [Tanacetum coccineum]
MVVVLVDVQIRVVDVASEVAMMDLKDPVANYPWLKHVGYEVVFVVVEVLEERMKRFDKCSFLRWILMVHEVVKEISFLEVEKEIEQESWNLTMKGDDIDGYTNHFHELAVMCPTLVTPEYKKNERYIWWLPERAHGNVTSSKPATIHEAVCMTCGLVDQAVRAKATRISDTNKRKWQEAAKSYVTAPAEGKVYLGNLPLCNRCKLHHLGQLSVKCRKCKKTGHQTKDYWSKTLAADTLPTTDANAYRGIFRFVRHKLKIF